MGVLISMSPRAAAVRLVLGTVAVLAITLATVPAHAQGRLDESEVKAAFLYNLAKFVQWPPSADRSDQLLVGVIGNDLFGNVLTRVVWGKRVQGRKIVVRQLRPDEDLRMYHIVFVGALATRHSADILLRVQAAGVLTVGEAPDFIHEGGHVRFYSENYKVRIQIDAAGAEQAGLKISSQLLSLSR